MPEKHNCFFNHTLQKLYMALHGSLDLKLNCENAHQFFYVEFMSVHCFRFWFLEML